MANADNNDVAAIDISEKGDSKMLGFIPTGWYPSALALSADGRKLYVGTGKGLGFRNNFPPQTDYLRSAPDPKKSYDYIGGVLSGANINTASADDLNRLGGRFAKAIIRRRPYGSVDELVSKRVLTRSTFSQIKDQITVN